MDKLCESCEEKPGVHTRLGYLCDDCKLALETQEQERIAEEAKKASLLAEDIWFAWTPSISYRLIFNRIKESGSNKISPDKLVDFVNTNVDPLVHLLSQEEIERMFIVVKEYYHSLQREMTMRPTEQFRESEIIKKQTKRDKTTEKFTKQIEKQKKFASKDRTLTKEERGLAKLAEGLAANNIPQTEIDRLVKTAREQMKGKK
jgi:hypothetical protein